MPKPWYSIKAAAADAEVAEVSILDVINPFYGVGAQMFLGEFRAIKQDKVKVFINSPGGSVTEALAMFNGMRATGKYIEAHVLGIAASAASYIAMAADKVVMPRNTLMLPHKPSNPQGGTADDHRDVADMLDTIEGLLLPAYMSRWKGTEQELRDLLAEDRLLTADECLELGFCDEVVDEITATASFEVDYLPAAAQALFARATPPVAAPPAAPAAVALAEFERIAAAAGVSDYAGSLALDARLTTVAAIEAAAAEAADIVAMCRMTSRLDAAAGYVRARASLADVRAQIQAAVVAEDEQRVVDTAPLPGSHTPAAKADINPFALWADIKAQRARSKA